MRRIFVWTERQDALFETLSNDQVAARTGKTPRQVMARRYYLKARRSLDVRSEKKSAQLTEAVNNITGGESLNLAATIPDFRSDDAWTTAELQILAKIMAGEATYEALTTRSVAAAQSKANRMLRQGFRNQFTLQPIIP